MASKSEIRSVDWLITRHLRFGWWALLIFLTLGFALEAMHGFKVGFYMNTENETRRLMWTLAHAHGTLIALLHIAFACSLRALQPPRPMEYRVPSACLLAAGVLIPAGFFLGGWFFFAGDPGFGILLLPIGAILLFTAVLIIARKT